MASCSSRRMPRQARSTIGPCRSTSSVKASSAASPVLVVNRSSNCPSVNPALTPSPKSVSQVPPGNPDRLVRHCSTPMRATAHPLYRKEQRTGFYPRFWKFIRKRAGLIKHPRSPTSSDVQNQLGKPPFGHSLQDHAMPGCRLDFVVEHVPSAVDRLACDPGRETTS